MFAFVASLLIVGAAPYPAELTRPMKVHVEPFTWPKPEVFTAGWKNAEAKRSVTVLELDGTGTVRWFIATRVDDLWRLEPAVGYWGKPAPFTSSVVGDTIVLTNNEKVRVVSRSEEQLSGDARVAWSYMNTLLETNGPLYPSNSKFRPAVGPCGRDLRPQDTRAFAELAYSDGDLGRFLQLQLRITEDSLRPGEWWSNRQAAKTGASRLLSTGIDIDTFLIGVGLHTADQPAWLEASQLTKTIREVGRAEQMLPKMKALAESPSLDAANRLVATQVWVGLQLPDVYSEKAIDELRTKSKSLSLHPIARAWLELPAR